MKVKTLINFLEQHDGETLVVLSADGEGNSYSPVADIVSGIYIPENTWSGEFVHGEEEIKEWEGSELIKKCIALYPVC